MLIECFAQILSPSVQMQDFYSFAVVLCQCPGLIGFVGFKSLILRAHQECDGVVHHIVGEGNKILSPLPCWGG